MFLFTVGVSQGWLQQFANLAQAQDFASCSCNSCDKMASFFLRYVVQ